MSKQLIQGARASAPKFQSYRLFGVDNEMTRAQQYKRMQDERLTRRYIENLPADIEIAKLPPSMRGPVTQYLNANRIKYGQMARMLAKAPAGSPQYMRLTQEMQGIQGKFKTLSTELDNFKNLKTEFLQDFDEGIISKGANTDALLELFKKDDYEIDLSDGLAFKMEDGSYLAAKDIDPHFNRNATAVDELLKINQQAYKNALPIDETSDYLYRRQIRQLVTAGGRDGLISLAVDKFLDNPMIDIDNPKDPMAFLLKEENHDQLREFVINNWMDGIKSAANQAYNLKRRSSVPSGAGIDIAQAMKVWQSGDLMQLANMLPLDSKINIEAYDDGYDISLPGRKLPFTVNPEDNSTLPLFLKALGISNVDVAPYIGAKIDTSRI